MSAIIPESDSPEVRKFLDDLWRLCTKHELMIEENGIVTVMVEDDYCLGGFDLSDHGDILPGKRGPI